MSVSAPFIRRPVATTLLTIAIGIAGAIAYTVLPASPLPQVDFPTININTGLPGASAEIMASSVATPLERQLGPHCRHHGDDFVQFAGQHKHHHPVRFEPQHRWCRTRRGSCHQRGAHLLACEPAVESHLPQSESGGFAHHDSGADFRRLQQRPDVRCRVDGAGAAHLADPGRGPGFRCRRVPARRSRGIEPHADEQLRNLVRANREHAAPGQRPRRARPNFQRKQRRPTSSPTIRWRLRRITSR